jgi:hypothetical protein
MATIGMSSGKWYWECTVSAGTTSPIMGITNTPSAPSVSNYPGFAANGWGYEAFNGNKVNNASSVSYGSSYTTNDVVGVTFDADARELVFYKNGVSQGVAYTGLAVGDYFPAFGDGSALGTWTGQANFGQRPFAYTPPTGFKALNTQNLPEPVIARGNLHFDATTYTGNGTTLNVNNAAGFSPDLVWIKSRSGAANHGLHDRLRGEPYALLSSNTTDAESTGASYISSFGGLTSTGFQVNSNSSGNGSGATFVGWQWKASGSTVTNTAGSITSTVSANPTAGFSIVTYTGTGANATVGHGLGVAPRMVIVKARNVVAGWFVQHASLPAANVIELNSTSATYSSPTVWNSTAPTSSLFSVGTSSATNGNTNTYVAYCFSEVAGYSRFGSYTGNGSADGPFVFCGFRPRFVMIKRTDSSSNWWMIDTSRAPINQMANVLLADSSGAEFSSGTGWPGIDYLSNGFKLRGTANGINASGGTWIFMAFAEHPFKLSLAR